MSTLLIIKSKAMLTQLPNTQILVVKQGISTKQALNIMTQTYLTIPRYRDSDLMLPSEPLEVFKPMLFTNSFQN